VAQGARGGHAAGATRSAGAACAAAPCWGPPPALRCPHPPALPRLTLGLPPPLLRAPPPPGAPQICRDLSFRRTLGEQDLAELRAMSLGGAAAAGAPPPPDPPQ
jgi:hypothetical protein